MPRVLLLSLLLTAGCPPVEAPGKDEETDLTDETPETDTETPPDDTDTTPPRDTAPDTDDTEETDSPGDDTDPADTDTDPVETDTVDTDPPDSDATDTPVETDTEDSDAETDSDVIVDTVPPADTTPPVDTALPIDTVPPVDTSPSPDTAPPVDSSSGADSFDPSPDTSLGDTSVTDTGAPPDPPDSGVAGDSFTPADSAAVGDTGTPPSDTTSTGADTADSGAGAAFSAALTVDGDLSDCPPEAVFATSSGAGTWACITWTATDLYIGYHHPDVGSGGPEHWMWMYLGGLTSPGAFSGVAYGSQQPDLAPNFQNHLRWKASGTYNGLLHWVGLNWGNEDIDYLWTTGAVAEDNGRNDVELRIPLADVTNTGLLLVSMGWTRTSAGAESTYAAVPSVAFADGYDPDLGAWFLFDLSSPAAPSSYTPVLRP